MDDMNDFSGASWITAPEQKIAPEGRFKKEGIEVAYYRHSFFLQEKCTLTISVSASSRYRLWINGRHVTMGPCKGDRWSHYYETVEVSEYLCSGENIIAAKVVAYPPYEAKTGKEQGPLWSISNAAGPCFILKGVCLDNKGTVIADITTGQADWRVQYDRAINWQLFELSHWMGSMEVVDGKNLPYGWKTSSFDESQWLSAAVKWSTQKNPFGIIPVLPLQKRPIPLLYEQEKGFSREMSIKKEGMLPFSFVKSDEGLPSADTKHSILLSKAEIPPHSLQVVELDAGELTTGYFQLAMEGGAGSEIKIRYAECYSHEGTAESDTTKGLRDDSENFAIIGHEDIYYPSGQSEVYEPFHWRAFRFIRIEVRTFGEGIIIFPPTYIETGYPLEIRSSISSSDPWIERIRPMKDKRYLLFHSTGYSCWKIIIGKLAMLNL